MKQNTGRIDRDGIYEDILRYCIYHAPDKTAAEDAVQETFLKVIRYMPNYRHRGKFRAFLYKVAANTCKDQWRKCAREEWFDTDSEASDGEKKLSEEMIYLETGYAKTEGNINFLRLIRELSKEQREVVYLKYAQELRFVKSQRYSEFRQERFSQGSGFH